jgi:hypothetical protein
MDIQTVPARGLLADRRRNFVAAVVGISLLTISNSAFGTDLRPEFSATTAVAAQSASPRRWPIEAHRIDPADVEPDLAARNAYIVDQLYDELMRETAPECSWSTNAGAIGRRC